MPRARIAALAAIALATASACDRPNASLGASTAHADPTTTPNSPGVFPPEKIDTLLLSLDEVNRIVPGDEFRGPVAPPETKPVKLTPSGASPECSPVIEASFGEEGWFRNDWEGFRFARYSGFSNVSASQGILVYQNLSLAQGAFDQWISTAKQCDSAKQGIEFNSIESNLIEWTSTSRAKSPNREGQGPTKTCVSKAEPKTNIILYVDVCLYQNAEESASNVLKKIEENI